MTWSRREFVKAASAAPFVSPFVRWVPHAADSCLLVVELVGGNDGLNTVIPRENDDYARARPSLGSARERALAITDDFGLHESMAGMRGLFDAGELAVVFGVGYPNPDRSHFRSRDIWHTGDPSLVRKSAATTGWLGRAADAIHATSAVDVPAVGVGSLDVPLALQGQTVRAPVMRRIEDYTMLVPGDDPARKATMRELVQTDAPAAAPDDPASFVRDVAKAGVAQSERMRRALDAYRAKADYPNHEFGRAMQLAARVLLCGFGARLCHVPLDGFDTHARQAPTHAGLLRQLSQGVTALTDDLRAHGALERVTILVHSEFGRRVAENQSQGTDHGAAAPVFVVGDVAPGLHGTKPDLTDLVDGDVRPTTDFRAVYAELLDGLGVPRRAVLGAGAAFERVGFRRGS